MVTDIDIDEINTAFRDAQALHKAGDVQAAAALYESLRRKIPDQPELLYLLGAAYVRLERPRDAVPLLERSLALRPDHTPAMEMAGSAWIKLQNPIGALEYFERAAKLRPSATDALCRLGSTLVACNRPSDAADAFQRVLAIDPNDPEAMTGEAQALHCAGHRVDAEARLRRCINVNPTYAQGYTILGGLLVDIERFTEAEHVLRKCLVACPGHAGAQHYLAIALHRQGKLQDAELAYREALTAGASGAIVFVQLGDALTDLGQLDEAESILTGALTRFANDAGLLTGLGRVAELRGDLDKAIAFHNRAIAADSDHADAFINRGNAWKFSGDFKSALADYDAALALDSSLSAAAANRGMTLLTLGRLSEGWPAFRSRIKARAGSVNLGGPTKWDGSPLDGKKILVWTEYGLGDEILFAGLLPELIAATASCTLVCSPRLVTLFRRAFPDATVHPLGDPIDGDFDVRLPLTDAAQWLRPSLDSFPAHNGYLKADPNIVERLRNRYRQTVSQRLVGLSWYSGGGIGTAPFKSIALGQWLPILKISGLKFISLQYGDCESDVQTVKQVNDIDIHLDREIDSSGDLDVFAAQVTAMDLVISVSNTTVHVAGALGIPVWALVPKGPGAHWYWFQDRTDSPWYPSLRIFRQPSRGHWNQSITEVAAHLEYWRQS